MFNKFRQDDLFWCYYEPFHHDIVNLRQDALEVWDYDEKTTVGMGHPVLNKPHFYEYKSVFRDAENVVPYFNVAFSYDEFTHVESSEDVLMYVNRLIDKSPQDVTPVLQFNRSSLRIGWFRENFNKALHLFLLRNPKDQFESYLRRGRLRKNWFLAINLYIYLKNISDFEPITLDDYLLELNVTSDNVTENLENCMKEAKKLPLYVHYEIFLHLWLLSLIEADKYSDKTIDMDEINSSGEHMGEIHNVLRSYDSKIAINFDDFKITHYDSFTLTQSEFETSEKRVMMKYDNLMSKKIEQIAISSIKSRMHCVTDLSLRKRFKRFSARILLRL